MAFSPRGEWLAFPQYDGTVDLFEISAGRIEVLPVVVRPPTLPTLPTIAFSKSGRSLAAAQIGREVTIWDVAERKPGRVLPLDPDTLFVLSLEFLDDDRALHATICRATAGARGGVYYGVIRWDLATGERLATEELGRHPLTLVLALDGRHGVVDDHDEAFLRDFKAGTDVDVGSRFTRFIFTTDGATLIACEGGAMACRFVADGRERRRVAVDPPIGPRGTGTIGLAVSADARLLAVGFYPKDHQAGLIELATGKVLAVVDCGPPETTCRTVQISPDGRSLATATHAVNHKDQPIDPYLKLWKVPAGW